MHNGKDRGKSKRIRLLMILALLLLLISMAGCVTCRMPAKPIKPRIDVHEYDGYVCFDKEDATKLFDYIIELETGYEQ